MAKSILQSVRASYQPKLPNILKKTFVIREKKGHPFAQKDEVEIKKIFPNMSGLTPLEFVSSNEPQDLNLDFNIGVLFSGGQAPGGHNVIFGMYDAIQKINPKVKLYGFILGPQGLVDHQYKEITAEIVESYRNTGGFDMIGTGRTKLEHEEQFDKGLLILKKLGIKTFLVIGGDDSNTNACVLAEYYRSKNEDISVIGCPKTIDGDLKGNGIEVSFGFDTACKVFSELIGNILCDCYSTKKYWHFMKLMGRSASHITLECALQTHPNIAIISEEVMHRGKTLDDVVNDIVEIVLFRSQKGMSFGTVLVPEGLIEFFPEIEALIDELNDLLVDSQSVVLEMDEDEQRAFFLKHLTFKNRLIFESLPKNIAAELASNRDPHGNINVSLIETEKLLSQMVGKRLDALREEGKFKGRYVPLHHFFGYEGRCSFPSNFDADYCYALGFSAVHIGVLRKSGYIITLTNLAAAPEEWKPEAIGIASLMNLEKRSGKIKPVIKKALVDINGAPFKEFECQRERWAKENDYTFPGPIQLFGPSEICDIKTNTLNLEYPEK